MRTGALSHGPTPMRVTVVGLALLALVGALLVAASPAGPATAADEDEPPTQYPFACTAQDHGLELIVDNHDTEGTPVRDDDGDIIGYSRDCEAETRFWYYAVDEDGQRHVVRDHDEGPIGGNLDDIEDRMADEASVATTELTDGSEVPYLIRHERGTINRFIYSTSMLTTVDEITDGDPEDPDRDHWNGRLLYQFQGGVGIGHSQGRYDDRGITGRPDRLAKGYAVIYSTATRTGDHYNLLLGGRTAEMVKDHFVDTHGEPDYTVGIGGSGGGIQQYVYAQNHPELLDAAIPQASYPDMTTQAIHVGDCALLDRWMDLEADDTEFWADWDNRQLIQGLNSIEGYLGSTAQGLNQARDLLESQFGIERPRQTGSSECLEGWLGLLPLAMNPLFGSESNWDLLGDQVDDIERTHWDDVREAYGTDPETGFARVPWDNVGVQYGLQALTDGELTPEQFLDLNAQVGSWVEVEDMVHEGAPFEDPFVVMDRIAAERGITTDEVGQKLASGEIPFTELFDPWSSRNAHTSPDGGDTPAPRRAGDVEAIRGAHESGLVFHGELEREIPIIDTREYLEHVLDMHNTHQSFAARQRLLDAQGHHDGHLVWFLDTDEGGDSPATAELMHAAFDTIAEWIDNLEADPSLSVAEAAPDGADDACYDVDGTPIATGEGVWAGILDDDAEGDCTQAFELFTTSRIEAGAPITGDVYKCRTMPAATAVEEGLYGDWAPTGDEVARLAAIHPQGVCDYELRGVGDPRGDDVPGAPVLAGTPDGLLVLDAEPGAEVQLRRGGEAVQTVTADADGRAEVTIDAGTTVAAQLHEGQRGELSAPAEAGSLAFSDVGTDHPFFDEIAWLVGSGITDGFADGTFRPTEVVTRQAAAAFLYRLAGEPTGPFDDPGFADVGADHPFRDAIAWAAAEGITEGYADDTFRPTGPVTRQAVVTFLFRFAGEPVGPHGDPGFTDVDEDHLFYEAIAWAADDGVVDGYADGTFRPAHDVTRQAIAAFLHRSR